MCHDLLRDASFHRHLLELDRRSAARSRQAGCLLCGGPLHTANYQRKARGGLELADRDAELRFSFCCGLDGCRRRTTPPSVRFLGRRVHVAVLVTLASVLTQGLTGRRLSLLRRELGLCRRTLERWLRWWRESVPRTGWWKQMRARLAQPVDVAALPAALFDRFGGEERERAETLLVELAPLSVTAQMAARLRMVG